jgi:hypothetical protein
MPASEFESWNLDYEAEMHSSVTFFPAVSHTLVGTVTVLPYHLLRKTEAKDTCEQRLC